MEPSPTSRLSDHYLTALGKYLEQGLQANLQAAREFGAVAVASGLDTLELAKIHEQALAELLAPDELSARRLDLTRSAEIFFSEAIVPIEDTHFSSFEHHADLDQLHTTLGQRTLDLADSYRELQELISERQQVQASLEHSEHVSNQLLKDSQLLDANLQDMARKMRTATEDERQKMSLHLNDEITQTLVGINIRLIALKKMIAANDKILNVEITTIHRLVEDSAEIINRLTHEFSFHNAQYAE